MTKEELQNQVQERLYSLLYNAGFPNSTNVSRFLGPKVADALAQSLGSAGSMAVVHGMDPYPQAIDRFFKELDKGGEVK